MYLTFAHIQTASVLIVFSSWLSVSCIHLFYFLTSLFLQPKASIHTHQVKNAACSSVCLYTGSTLFSLSLLWKTKWTQNEMDHVPIPPHFPTMPSYFPPCCSLFLFTADRPDILYNIQYSTAVYCFLEFAVGAGGMTEITIEFVFSN